MPDTFAREAPKGFSSTTSCFLSPLHAVIMQIIDTAKIVIILFIFLVFNVSSTKMSAESATPKRAVRKRRYIDIFTG
jgi:hypothetical protein